MEPELLRLRARVVELEQRLAEIELLVGVSRMPPSPPEQLEPVSWETAKPVEPPPPRTLPPPIPTLSAPPPKPDPQAEPAFAHQVRNVSTAGLVETNAGVVWLNRVAAVTAILFVAFGFKYAVDNEWIGPAGRVMLGILSGALALFAGDKLWLRGHRSFSQGITALGIAIFYLSFYAAYQLYELIPQTLALAGAIVTTAIAGALALRYDARVIAIIALLGGYLSPFLASSATPNDLFLGSYMFVLNAIGLTLARRKQWLSVEIFAATSTLLLFTIWIAAAGRRLTPIDGGAFVTLQFAVFALSPFLLIRALAPVPAMFGVGILCSFYSSPVYWTWAGLIALIGLALAWRHRDDRLLVPSLAGWIAGFLVWDPNWASHGTLFAGLATGFAIYLLTTLLLPVVPRTLFTYSALTLNALFFFGASYAWFDQQHHGYMGLLALAVAACYLGAALYLKRSGAPREMLLVAAGLALSFVTLAIPIQLSGYSITLAWAVESAVLAFLASRFQSRWPFAASWLVGLLALSVLFEHDAAQSWGRDYSPVINARFIPFLVTALGLAINAYFTSRLDFVPRLFAAVPLLAAHFTLLAGLHLEVFAWIGSGPEQDLTSQLTLASSLLLALYGLALVGHGISGKFTLHRILGLGLFALVVVKLYLFDVWQLDRFYRILAFGALAALLFSGSYLYSRYSHRLKALVQDEEKDANTPSA